ncbi:Flp family type IVb pilin [Roseateles sp. DC23W]|uniref:Flp family type IVb pilin n=1 Tax=Pelomonas dachongensis TaxID=3299029 RepID=A0ABW7EIV6_9BURK
MHLNTDTSRSQRGQGMTEYIIIVALIAVAAIGVYSMFGETVKNQTGAMAAALGGDNGNAKTHNDKAKAVNVDNADKVSTTKSLSDFTKNNQLSK